MNKLTEALKPFEARAIIEQLRKGTVPMEQVAQFTVGRQQWLNYIEDDLQHYIAEGGAKVRFINGDYGDGKTHFMSIIRHLARQHHFAVSLVVLTREVPIQKFEAVYQEALAQLAGQFSGVGIRALLNHWLQGLEPEFAHQGKALPERLAILDAELKALPDMEPNFANALVALVEHHFGTPPLSPGQTMVSAEAQAAWQQATEILYRWFEGAKLSKKELKPLQIFEILTKSNSKLLLRSLVSFLRYLGYQGFVLLLDELETVMAQAASARSAAYEAVRLLIDNTEQAHYLHVFFAVIPDILNSEKGFKSYDALWSRIRTIGDGSRLNYRSVLIDLHKTPLTPEELTELGLSIRKIHELAYRWEAKTLIDAALIGKICAVQQKMGLLSEVRLFIKQVIRYLDLAEQGESPADDIETQAIQSQREMEQEKLAQLQPQWDS